MNKRLEKAKCSECGKVVGKCFIDIVIDEIRHYFCTFKCNDKYIKESDNESNTASSAIN